MAHAEAVIHLPPSTVAKLVDQVVDKVLKELNVQKPSLGRIVLTHVDPAQNNGSDTAHASITRVFGEHPDGGWVVNIRVTLDAFTVPLWLTSVRLFDDPSVPGAMVGHTAWWPPRV